MGSSIVSPSSDGNTTVVDLQKTLKTMGLNTKGNKAELLSRLQQAKVQANSQEPSMSKRNARTNDDAAAEVVDCRCGSALDDGIPMVCCTRCNSWSPAIVFLRNRLKQLTLCALNVRMNLQRLTICLINQAIPKTSTIIQPPSHTEISRIQQDMGVLSKMVKEQLLSIFSTSATENNGCDDQPKI